MAKITYIRPLVDFFQNGAVLYAAGEEYPLDDVLERMRVLGQAEPVRGLSRAEKAERAAADAVAAAAARLAAQQAADLAAKDAAERTARVTAEQEAAWAAKEAADRAEAARRAQETAQPETAQRVAAVDVRLSENAGGNDDTPKAD